MTDFEEKLRKALPPVFTRATAVAVLGGVITAGTLANLDSSGDGPPKLTLGRKAAYERDSFIEWFMERNAKASGSNLRKVG